MLRVSSGAIDTHPCNVHHLASIKGHIVHSLTGIHEKHHKTSQNTGKLSIMRWQLAGTATGLSRRYEATKSMTNNATKACCPPQSPPTARFLEYRLRGNLEGSELASNSNTLCPNANERQNNEEWLVERPGLFACPFLLCTNLIASSFLPPTLQLTFFSSQFP